MTTAQASGGESPVRLSLLELLGRGASGSVWRARLYRRFGLEQEIAIKITGDIGEDLGRRIRDEARVIALLRHRAIVTVQEIVPLEDGRWGLLMELVEGASFLDLLRSCQVPPRVALELVAEIASALDSAWNTLDGQGRPLHLTHRDIKLANVMLCADGRVKLLDFGIAHVEPDMRESQTTEGHVSGTLGYMSPERLAGVNHERGDIYALGVVLYELCSRKRLGKTSADRAPHEAHVAQALGDIPPTAAAPLMSLIRRCLAYRPDERPTCGELYALARALSVRIGGPTLTDWAGTAVPAARPRNGPPGADQISLPRTLKLRNETPLPEITLHQNRLTALGVPLGVALAVSLVVLGLSWGRARTAPASRSAIVEAPIPAAAQPGSATEAVAVTPNPIVSVEPEATGPLIPRTADAQATGPPPRRVSGPASPPLSIEERSPPLVVDRSATNPVIEDNTTQPEAPAAPEVETYAQVRVTGANVTLWAESTHGRFVLPGALPAGGYVVFASFDGGDQVRVGDAWFDATAASRIRCDEVSRSCKLP